MKFLIAGLGSVGRRHLRNLLTLGERDILLYRTYRSTLPDDELAVFPVEKDLQAALALQPDVVIAANPTALHLDVTIPAAEVGCHLLLEKPVSHSMECIDELQAAVRRNSVNVVVGFQFRFHPGLQQVKRWLAKKVIGEPLSVRAVYAEYLPRMHPWEDYRQGYAGRADLGGGVVLTLCHPLDYLRWLLGEVNAVWAFTESRHYPELQVEESAEIGLRFDNGVVGSVHLDYNKRPTTHNLEIVGTEGTIFWDNADGAAHVFRGTTNEWETIPALEGFERNDLFLDEMRNFLAMMRGEEEAVCTLDDGIQALKLCLAALESAETRKLISRGNSQHKSSESEKHRNPIGMLSTRSEFLIYCRKPKSIF